MGSYDSISLWLPSENAGVKLLSSQIVCKLSGVTQSIQENGIESYSGGLGSNLRVRILEHGLSLNGSISKYFLSNNIECLSRAATEQAIEKLSDELSLPMKDAKLKKLDYAVNLVMKQKPDSYFPLFGESRYFKRAQFDSTLYYINTQRKLRIYDKSKESKKLLLRLPAALQVANLLRFELALQGKLCNQFNCPELTASSLYQEPFYMAVIDKLLQEYQAIRKNKVINLNFDAMKSPKDFWLQVNSDWIQRIGGEQAALGIVERMKGKDAFSKPEYYSRLKKEIREAAALPAASEDSPLLKELDEKMKRVKSYYR